jgi:drug/metabolite transporter (DMT)-like permease
MTKSLLKINFLGFASLLSATFLFSLFGVFTRIIADKMGVFYQMSTRVIIMSVIFLTIGLFSKSLSRINKQDLPLFLLRGIFIIADFSSFFIAVNNLSLGLTLFLFYAASIISNFTYGSILLHEKLNITKTVSLVFAFLGLVFIYASSFNSIKLIPSLFALLSGVCFGLTTSTSKKLTNKYSIIQVNLVAYVTAAFIGIFLLITTKETINILLPLYIWFSLISFAIIGVLAIYLVLYGYNKIEAQKASLIMLAELIFVVIIGYVIYKEIPSMSVLIGGIFILLALVLPSLNLKFISKQIK